VLYIGEFWASVRKTRLTVGQAKLTVRAVAKVLVRRGVGKTTIHATDSL